MSIVMPLQFQVQNCHTCIQIQVLAYEFLSHLFYFLLILHSNCLFYVVNSRFFFQLLRRRTLVQYHFIQQKSHLNLVTQQYYIVKKRGYINCILFSNKHMRQLLTY